MRIDIRRETKTVITIEDLTDGDVFCFTDEPRDFYMKILPFCLPAPGLCTCGQSLGFPPCPTPPDTKPSGLGRAPINRPRFAQPLGPKARHK